MSSECWYSTLSHQVSHHYLSLYLFIHLGWQMPWLASGGQMTIYKYWPLLSTTWILEVTLRSLGLVESIFTCCDSMLDSGCSWISFSGSMHVCIFFMYMAKWIGQLGLQLVDPIHWSHRWLRWKVNLKQNQEIFFLIFIFTWCILKQCPYSCKY